MERDPFHRVRRAWAAYEAKHYDVAEREARDALAVEPNNAEALSLLSLCAMQRHQHATAIQFAKQAIGRESDAPLYHYRLALIYARKGDDKAAEPALRDTLELAPEFAPAYSLFGWLYFARGHINIALSAVNEALKFDPYEPYALNLRIDLLKAKGDFEGARAAAEEALQVNPEDEYAHAMAGALKSKEPDRGAAVSHLREAVRLNPAEDWVRQAYLQVLEQHTLLSRVLLWIAKELRQHTFEYSLAVGFAWLVYLIARNQSGSVFGWPWQGIVIAVLLHGLMLAGWWGPLVSYLTLQDGQVRRIVAAEFAVRDRTRLARPSHISLSLAIILSVASLVFSGLYLAPFALGFVNTAIAFLLWEWSKRRTTKLVAWLYAAFVAGISLAWSVHPQALRFDKELPRSTMNHAFAYTMLLSLLTIAIWIEIRRRWRTERF